ncbi:MAG: hypothetical protein F6J94_00015 [Moorea sp. SIO1F2]|uniref:hypothetical protein n=1 Tax=Moorena sp. SIO1F2 TaxID=2607819 RepID=UPI0013B616DE|nr:hypothetical protein [Moorena sp. SIO1F2]NET80435.1 hypothetical protein [Moorena sp. SIO1F2]
MNNQDHNQIENPQDFQSQGVQIPRDDNYLEGIQKCFDKLIGVEKDYKNIQEIKDDVKTVIKIIKIFNDQNYLLGEKEISSIKGIFSKIVQIIEEFEEYIKKAQASSKAQARDNISQQLQQAVHENASLEKRITSLTSERDTLKNKVDDLDSQVKRLEEDRAKLLSIAGKKLRDKTKTVNLSSENPRNDEIFQQYKTQKSQTFHPVSKTIFNFLAEFDSSLKNNRRQEVSKIQSILSQKILYEGLKLFRSDKDEEKLTQVTQKVIQALSDVEGVNLTEQSADSSAKVKELVKEILKLVQNKDDTKTPLDSEGNIKQEVTDQVREDIYSTLKKTLNQQSPDFSKIDEEVDKLIKQGLKLVHNITIADSPGRLEIYDQGTPFDKEKHEDILGEEEGTIELTIFPAYLVEDRVYERASVMVAPKTEEQK